MQTILIDILNNKAVRFLQDMELLQLIRMRREKTLTTTEIDWAAKYKGAMTKQPLTDVENQLNKLRYQWE